MSCSKPLPLSKLAAYKKRIKQAQTLELHLSEVVSENTVKLIRSHADAVGCPREFIFFPLLTTIAYCCGAGTSINVNQEWQEPIIIWFVCAAR